MAMWEAVLQAAGQHGAIASSLPLEWEPKPAVLLLQIAITSHTCTVLMVICGLCL